MDAFRISVLIAISTILVACGSDNAPKSLSDKEGGPLSTPEDVLRHMYSGWFYEKLPQQAITPSAKVRATHAMSASVALAAIAHTNDSYRVKQLVACSEGSASHVASEVEIDPMLAGESETLPARVTTYDGCVSYIANPSTQQQTVKVTTSGEELVACGKTSRASDDESDCSGSAFRYTERGATGGPYIYSEEATSADGSTISTEYRSDEYFEHRERVRRSDDSFGYEVFYYSSGSTTYHLNGQDYYLGHRIGRPDEPMHYGYYISDVSDPVLADDSKTEQYSYTIEWLLFGHDSSTRTTCSFSEYEVSTLVPLVSRITVTRDVESGAIRYGAAPQSGLVQYEQDGARATLEFLGNGVIEIVDSTGRKTTYRDPASVLAAAGDCGPPFPAS